MVPGSRHRRSSSNNHNSNKNLAPVAVLHTPVPLQYLHPLTPLAPSRALAKTTRWGWASVDAGPGRRRAGRRRRRQRTRAPQQVACRRRRSRLPARVGPFRQRPGRRASPESARQERSCAGGVGAQATLSCPRVGQARAARALPPPACPGDAALSSAQPERAKLTQKDLNKNIRVVGPSMIAVGLWTRGPGPGRASLRVRLPPRPRLRLALRKAASEPAAQPAAAAGH